MTISRKNKQEKYSHVVLKELFIKVTKAIPHLILCCSPATEYVIEGVPMIEWKGVGHKEGLYRSIFI